MREEVGEGIGGCSTQGTGGEVVLGRYSVGGCGTGVFEFCIFVGESIIENFEEEGFGVGVGFIL